MAVTVKRITLWRAEVENRPGVLARTLEPLRAAGADLKVLMGYRYRGADQKAAIEVYPVSGKKMMAAAASAGLASMPIPTLLVEGDDKAGMAHTIAQALAESGINLGFMMAQVAGKKYSAVIGFENEADAKKASQLIKKAGAKKRK